MAKPTSAALSSEFYDLIDSLDLGSNTTRGIMIALSRYGDARWWDGYGTARISALELVKSQTKALINDIDNI